jgi:L-seryl-tRNA(Ser) seleniumtransferase
MSTLLDRLGVPRRINAAGTLTRLGGALMDAEVMQAMQDAASASVDIAQLQSAASHRIAALTGAEAGLVTSGASAGLTLATAACLAGWDAARMAALPDTRGMRSRMLMLRQHRNSYDHAVRLAGANLADVGHNDRGTGAGVRTLEAWELEAAIDEQCAGFVFVATPSSLACLPVVLAVMHRHGLPVIVDAAAQLPPAANLRRFVDQGADLVVFSGGKALGGPQASGLLIGRGDLIGSALLQMMDMDVHPETWAPADLVDRHALRGTPLHGIGRGFKVGKEEIAGLLCALERFVSRDEGAQRRAWAVRLQAVADALRGTVMPDRHGAPAWRVSLLPVTQPLAAGVDGEAPVPWLELALTRDGRPDPGAALALCRRLHARPVPVHLGEGRLDEGVLTVNPLALRPEDDAALADALSEALTFLSLSTETP